MNSISKDEKSIDERRTRSRREGGVEVVKAM
jgi:hypothetical protein